MQVFYCYIASPSHTHTQIKKKPDFFLADWLMSTVIDAEAAATVDVT